jgi:hypothetical protein
LPVSPYRPSTLPPPQPTSSEAIIEQAMNWKAKHRRITAVAAVPLNANAEKSEETIALITLSSFGRGDG